MVVTRVSGAVAREAGFKRIVLACEPTDSRWKPLLHNARDTGPELVCVNPILVARGREGRRGEPDKSLGRTRN